MGRSRRRAIVSLAVAGLVITACGDDDGDDAAGADTVGAADVSAETDAPTQSSAPADTEAPVETDAPVVTDAPVDTEAPVETDAPVETEAPMDTEAPVESDVPVDTEAPADGTSAGVGEFCSNVVAIQQQLNGAPDPAAVAETTALLIETSPPDLAGAVAAVTAGVQQMADSGFADFSAMESPEVQAAIGEIDPWLFENCPFDATADVVGVEYAYDGVAAEYPAGLVGFRLTNEGNEAHELSVVRKADGVELSWEEIFQLPEDQVEASTEFVGNGLAAAAGDQALVLADLAPGEYIAVCFLPVGSVADGSGGVSWGQGQPHAFEGMVTEFTVS